MEEADRFAIGIGIEIAHALFEPGCHSRSSGADRPKAGCLLAVTEGWLVSVIFGKRRLTVVGSGCWWVCPVLAR